MQETVKNYVENMATQQNKQNIQTKLKTLVLHFMHSIQTQLISYAIQIA